MVSIGSPKESLNLVLWETWIVFMVDAPDISFPFECASDQFGRALMRWGIVLCDMCIDDGEVTTDSMNCLKETVWVRHVIENARGEDDVERLHLRQHPIYIAMDKPKVAQP